MPCSKFCCNCVPCHTSVFLNDFFNYLLVGFSWGCSRATALRLILDARVPIFKMLYPSSNTTSTHHHTHVEVWWISAAGISSLTRNSMTARWQNETSLSAILYHLFMVTWCKLLKPYLAQRYDNSWRHLPNNTQSFDVAELPAMQCCSWLLVWPSYIWRKCVICSWCSCFNVEIYIYIYWLAVSLNVVLGRHKNGVKNCCVCFRTSTGTH